MMINNGDNEKAGLYFYNNINNINQQLFRGGNNTPPRQRIGEDKFDN